MKRLEWAGFSPKVIEQYVDTVMLETEGVEPKRIEIQQTKDGRFRISCSGDIVVTPNAANSINVDVK